MHTTANDSPALAAIADTPPADRLATAITMIGAAHPDRVAVVSAAGTDKRATEDYRQLAARLVAFSKLLETARPIGVIARSRRIDTLAVIAAACGRLHVPLALLGDDSRDLTGTLSDWVVVDDSLAVTAAEGRHGEYRSLPAPVVVATSGTSGPPKLVEHSWESLLSAARLAGQWHALAWLLVYDATRWAGIQVWLQALLTGGTVVTPASRDPDQVARALGEERVAVLPGTPTLLRRLVTAADRALLRGTRPERITLGGEAADGALLELIRASFPAARISQVYATTELGEVFRVADGLAGFPADWIGKTLPGGVRLAVRRDGELLVQLSRDTAQVATGDLVERRGERYEFTGRRSDVIVVGGAKVLPRRVEDVLRAVPGIADARVWGMPSAITGELVAAEMVLADPLPAGATPEQVRAAALAACRSACEPAAVPRVLDIVKRIATTPAGKVPRRPVGRI
ncbi:MAG: AMP-binding protein [Planctomycetes bacterium]|nr:AMP-binding protein [Planctomycetota bacterium]